MCLKPDSLVSSLAYLLLYLISNFYLLFSKTRQHLRCNLLFDLIGHFGLFVLSQIDDRRGAITSLKSKWCLSFVLLGFLPQIFPLAPMWFSALSSSLSPHHCWPKVTTSMFCPWLPSCYQLVCIFQAEREKVYKTLSSGGGIAHWSQISQQQSLLMFTVLFS